MPFKLDSARWAEIESLPLPTGVGDTESGLCAVARIVYACTGNVSDAAAADCIAPTVRSYLITLNDALPPELRARLGSLALAERVLAADTSLESERRRAFMCADAAVRTFAVVALRSAKLDAEADKLASLPPIVDEQSAADAAYAADAADAAYAADAADAAYAAYAAADAAAYANAADAAAARAAANAAANTAYAAYAADAAADAARAARAARADAAARAYAAYAADAADADAADAARAAANAAANTADAARADAARAAEGSHERALLAWAPAFALLDALLA
jgi:SWI/SNF-related matrix-associated actin-dependent regulator 1 of chromatin subfamily A